MDEQRRLIRLDPTGENQDVAGTATIGDDEIASLKSMHGFSGEIADKDIQLHGMGGRLQDHRIGRPRLRDGAWNGPQEKHGNRGPAKHLVLIIAARVAAPR